MSLPAWELRALQAVADHGSYKAAALELGVSRHSVHVALRLVRRRVRARNTTHAVAIGIREGWLK